MKVIKRGQKETRWVGECVECGTVVIAEVSDIKTVDTKSIAGKSGFADCPNCEKKRGITAVPLKSQAGKNVFRRNDLDWNEFKNGE